MLQVYWRPNSDAWALLSDALALHGISPLPRVARTEKGKPYFPDFPNLHFSLSHTNGASLCALSDSLVGVDIEPIRLRREGIWKFCMTEDEFSRFQSQGAGWEQFYRIWTLKEAWCKYTGDGLGHPKKWPLPPPCPHRSYLLDGFAAAVCSTETPPDFILL